MQDFVCCSIAAMILVPGVARAQSPQPQLAPVAQGQLPPPATAAVANNAKIAFETPIFDFGRASAGEIIKHTFYFTNVGTTTLVINSVQPSCGCTTAGDWSRQVPPGGSGSIPMQFSTATFSGPVAKSINITSNDKEQPSSHLQIRGTVWKPVEVVPTYAVLNLQPDSPSGSTTVGITNNTDGPVEVFDAQVLHPAFGVKIITNVPGKAYQITVTAVPPFKPGSASSQVTAKTSYTASPSIQFTAWLNVQPPLTVVPPTINLVQSPSAPASPVITIINNTTAQLALTNAKVNVPGVGVQVKDIQQGKYSTITLAFPAGFEMPGGVAAELTADTGLEKNPQIKVPIYQAIKSPAASALPAGQPHQSLISLPPGAATPQARAVQRPWPSSLTAPLVPSRSQEGAPGLGK